MTDPKKTVPCAGKSKGGRCETPLLWGMTEDGKKVPLDTKAVVFRVVGEVAGELQIVRETGVFVTHFATCSDRNMFGRNKK